MDDDEGGGDMEVVQSRSATKRSRDTSIDRTSTDCGKKNRPASQKPATPITADKYNVVLTALGGLPVSAWNPIKIGQALQQSIGNIKQETFLKARLDFKYPGYNIFRKDRGTGDGGGLAMFLKHGLSFSETMDTSDEAKMVHFKDSGGNKIKFLVYRGLPMPEFPGDQGLRMRRIREFPARADDVYVCGYPKSGANWLWEICNMLLTGNREYYKGNKMMAMLEFCDQDHFAEMGSPRCLSHHFRFEDIPPDVFRKGSKMVYILRNPKDVSVSHYHHHKGLVGVYDYHGNWADYFQLWLDGKVDYGKWTTYVTGWEKGIKENPNAAICVVHYEDLKMNFNAEVRNLAKFLGVSRTEEFFKEMTKKCDIATMRTEKTKVGYTQKERQQWLNGEVKFIRKGVIGDWKNHFTISQNERFDEMYEKDMKSSKLNFVFES